MAAAGNHMTDQRFMDDTFFLSNMAPQVGRGFNRDKWEHLERYVRKLVKVRENKKEGETGFKLKIKDSNFN